MILQRKTILLFVIILFSFHSSQAQKNLTQYVNPLIGTGGHAHTFPGACYPFGMMQLSPDTRLTGWDGCSGYYYADDTIYGFTHTHLSGTGCSDYGDILLMPFSKLGYPNTVKFQASDSISPVPDEFVNYSSVFSHNTEKATAGYYSVILKKGNIKAELTVGKYAGIHRYTYCKDSNCGIILNLNHRNKVIRSEFHKISDTEVCGYLETIAWTRDKKLYYDIRFSRPFWGCQVYNNDTAQKTSDISATNIKVVFGFINSPNVVLSKVGISAVSVENAKENLVHDIPNWDFDGTLKKTQQAWNDYLHKIEVTSKDDSLLTTFYTALYHTAIHPSLYTDVNGQYRGRDNKIHTAKGFTMYTVFSLWDTYRAIHPLYTIIDSSIDRQFIQTFLRQYEQGGVLPVWELSANETNCMIAYHSVSVIYDAYQKGIRGFDANEALIAMEHSADSYDRAKGALEKYGYIPADLSSESVSQTEECGYDDWCIAQMAKALGKNEEYEKYIGLSQGYKNVYNPNNGFMQGRDNGRFCVPFEPRAVTFNYTEANAWQYSFYAPQDMNGLIELHGGKEKLAAMIDTMFNTSSKMTGREQPDITGMIGQYAQGNEPSHHIAYLFDYLGQPWKTADYVHKLEKFYTDKPDGICGNDDCGELSAWYVMSAIGMYQVCPGDGQFELTTPLFDTVKLHLENGKTFSIYSKAIEPLSTNIYGATLNNNSYEYSYLKYSDLMKGGKLDYWLYNRNAIRDSMVNSNWGTGNYVPVDSIPLADKLSPVPYLEYSSPIFTDSLQITMHSFLPNDTVFFDTTHNLEILFQNPYVHPFYIHNNTWLTYWRGRETIDPFKRFSEFNDYRKIFYNFRPDVGFTKISKDRKIKIVPKPNSQYTAGGPNALLDGQHGSTDFRLGKWQGYQYNDFEAVIDLGKTQTISTVSAEFLQDVLSYIIMPKYVDFSVSTDSIHFTPVAHVVNTLPDTSMKSQIKSLSKTIIPVKARYVKVFAKNYGKLPPWHAGYPDSAFIFIDEIEIR